MGSGEAKKFRALYGSAGRHGDSFWAEEQSNIGLKLLKGMGWETGQGLGKSGNGCTAAIKQFRKKDNAGIGATAATRDETFRASQDLFNGILSRLGGKDSVEETTGSTGLGGSESTVKGAMAKRQLTARFRRAKDTAKCNAKDLNEILGRPSATFDLKMECPAVSTAAAADQDASDGQHTSTASINEYFARRRQELGLAPCSSSTRVIGFTEEEQAQFAEQQMAISYSGRFGLGHAGNSTQVATDANACTAPSVSFMSVGNTMRAAASVFEQSGRAGNEEHGNEENTTKRRREERREKKQQKAQERRAADTARGVCTGKDRHLGDLMKHKQKSNKGADAESEYNMKEGGVGETKHKKKRKREREKTRETKTIEARKVDKNLRKERKMAKERKMKKLDVSKEREMKVSKLMEERPEKVTEMEEQQATKRKLKDVSREGKLEMGAKLKEKKKKKQEKRGHEAR
mmetsp:Transcript_1635/g.2665  ORF Transcript_1635/g.2665 Transcript_1635/m.2665 type:complete len:461 (-) Transcript_1635:227-1609(-)